MKNKKNVSLVISTLLMTFLLLNGGCSRKVGPEDTVETYFRAAKKFDINKMTSTMLPSNSEDIEEMTEVLDETKEDNYAKYFLDYLKTNAKKMTYKVGDSEVTGDNAVVTVDCKYVDGGPLLEATVGQVFVKAMSVAFSGEEMTDEETAQLFTSIMEEQNKTIAETFKEVTLKVKCIKQEDKWYITETNDELLDVVMSGFISAEKEISKNFGDFGEEN